MNNSCQQISVFKINFLWRVLGESHNSSQSNWRSRGKHHKARKRNHLGQLGNSLAFKFDNCLHTLWSSSALGEASTTWVSLQRESQPSPLAHRDPPNPSLSSITKTCSVSTPRGESGLWVQFLLCCRLGAQSLWAFVHHVRSESNPRIELLASWSESIWVERRALSRAWCVLSGCDLPYSSTPPPPPQSSLSELFAGLLPHSTTWHLLITHHSFSCSSLDKCLRIHPDSLQMAPSWVCDVTQSGIPRVYQLWGKPTSKQ